MIYLDPPFNSNRDYAAPVGSEAAGAAFKDTWTLDDVDEAWVDEIEERSPAMHSLIEAAGLAHGDGMKSYLIMMGARLLELKRVLKPTGSIYLHCDPTAAHYLKALMDVVFGASNFKNEVVWKRTSSHNRAKRWGPVHDTLLYYSNGGKATWNRELEPLSPEYIAKFYRHEDKHGKYQVDNLTGPGPRTGDTGKPWRGIDPSDNSRHWELPPDRALPDWFVFPEGYADMPARKRLDVLDEQGLIYWPPRGTIPRFKRYLGDHSGAPVTDTITDIAPLAAKMKEKVGYPTQKPLALMERIIRVSSNPGDMVLDPFCGCATTLVAAETEGREWAGVDLSPLAVKLVSKRLHETHGAFGQIIDRTDPPRRTDLGDEVVPAEYKGVMYGEQRGYCNGCGYHFQYRNLAVDHIIPRVKEGTDHAENLQLLCTSCNSMKGVGTHEALLAKLKAQGLMNT